MSLLNCAERIVAETNSAKSESIKKDAIFNILLQEYVSESPLCGRCLNEMTPQFYENKITWWTCEPCADEEDGK